MSSVLHSIYKRYTEWPNHHDISQCKIYLLFSLYGLRPWEPNAATLIETIKKKIRHQNRVQEKVMKENNLRRVFDKPAVDNQKLLNTL